MSKKPWLEPGPMTGWKPGLLQDDHRPLSVWFASRPDSREIVRHIFGEQRVTTLGHQRQDNNHANLKAQLLATGDNKLVEGNHWGDTYWGVCRGVGQNKLGEILMLVRDHLRLA